MGCDLLAAEKALRYYRPVIARCPDTAGFV